MAQASAEAGSFNPSLRFLSAAEGQGLNEFINKSLFKHGYAATAVSNAQQVISMAKDTSYNVLLLDIGAKEYNALELCKSLRADLTFSGLVIIVVGPQNLLNKGSLNKRGEALRAGADDFILLPLDENEFLEIINARFESRCTLKQLKAAEGLYQSLIEYGADAFLLFNAAGELLFFNNKALSLPGCCKEALSQPQEAIKRSPFFESIKSVVELAVKKQAMVYKTLTGESSDKSPCFYEIRGVPSGPDGLEYERIQIIIRDISDRVNNDKIFARTEKINSLSILTAGIAHEIKNPLAIISNIAQILQKSPEKLCERMLEGMLTNIKRIARIIDDLNFFSHQEHIQEGSFELMPVIRDMASIMRYQDKKEPLVVQIPTEIKSCLIEGSPSQLQQLLVNLLINAYQAIDKDGVVKIQVEKREDSVVISVIDNGCGIEQAQLDAVFDPFFTTKRNWFGTGLGLAVSHRIVQSFRGTIHAYSEVNKGSRFIITLPLAKKAVKP